MRVWYIEKSPGLNQEKCVLVVTLVSNLIILGGFVKFSGTSFHYLQIEEF